MRALVVERFGETPRVEVVSDPVCAPDGAIVRVEATGLCRSDWHGWAGHDPDIRLPHVPGHEFAGTIEAIGSEVTGWSVGDRVTCPFVAACGRCTTCVRGDQQICENQEQPGFTYWGSFAEFVEIRRADVNLVAIPDDMSYVTAASLGCRFATAYRAVTLVGRVSAGESVVVHGCGGVGLSAVMIARAAGAHVIGVDLSPESRALALANGAERVLDPREEQVLGTADLSIDAFGSAATMAASVRSLRRGGRHVQVGLLLGDEAQARVPMDLVIAGELQLLGSHGLAAHDYPPMLASIASGALRPDRLLKDHISLEEAGPRLAALGTAGAGAGGITLIRP
jgi:alcohol dehydrogenase